jgi:hypothetical protein
MCPRSFTEIIDNNLYVHIFLAPVCANALTEFIEQRTNIKFTIEENIITESYNTPYKDEIGIRDITPWQANYTDRATAAWQRS